MSALNYSQAGVDREAADRLVERIALMSRATLNKRVKNTLGGYASLFELDSHRWIAASTDGVGTKLKLAFFLDEHQTVGIDLVAMSVNDLLCVGAEPLFFLDYFATGQLKSEVAEQVLKGIIEGCRQAKCALVGGETAEMPGFYQDGEYDLAGFAVGMVSPKRVLPKASITPGDVILGMGSSGCHSNGYSLLRMLLQKEKNAKAKARELLAPTRIYSKALVPLLKKNKIKGLAHITGSGFLNVPRISEKVSYVIQMPPQAERPEIFQWIQKKSQLPFAELAQTFNMGVGMVVVVAESHAREILKHFKQSGEQAWILGEVISNARGQGSQVLISDQSERVVLE